MLRTLCFVSLLLLAANLPAFDAMAFRAGVSKQGKIYQKFTGQPETERLFTQGKVSESNTHLKALVPDAEKTAYDYFILGNMLFQNDFDASYKFMVKAEKTQPDNPYILFERGIHEHRLGNYPLARTYYEKYQEIENASNNPLVNAYLTHVYLMTGQVKKAFATWKQADFSKNHTSIEKSMYTIFSKNNQERTRESLIAAINRGEKIKLCDLYQLDSSWELDWWNNIPNQKYLAYDRKLADSALKSGSLDEKYFNLCSSTENMTDTLYIERLKQTGLLGNNPSLPESSSLIYEIAKRLTSSKSMSPAEFLKKFENQLTDLSKKHPDDRKYFDVLAFLYAQTANREKLKSVDYYGWKQLKVAEYAQSYISGLDPGSEKYQAAVYEALKDFPMSAPINAIRLSFETQNKKDALLKFVASQFANVKNNWQSPFRLNDYMQSLQHELEKLE